MDMVSLLALCVAVGARREIFEMSHRLRNPGQ
jgi:hypothetical protein